ncbi:phosphate ABC transporter permease subunit PstC [Nocardioides albus]|uniref:Phosphate transport system permease protein n=1 Tax=Nocardioides albus TaxID=1841 RepID=A0A7W5AAA3_9ACTN|nr:phosphate ABC transporter permease subunit PstC [Nocardioides albus]MBB3092315.1 phosphate transport system permease protein [Nocardioides albus]GGU47231.1 phosphate transport system permease protein [Nocardioides albus]
MTVAADPGADPGVDTKSELSGRGSMGDVVFRGIAVIAATLIMVALAAVFIFLGIEGIPGFSVDEQHYAGQGSFLGLVVPLLYATMYAAVLALIVAVPFSVAIALFISHYAPRRIATPVAYVIDLLAAVPSVVFGLWGAVVLGPYLVPTHAWLSENLAWLPFFDGQPSGNGRTLFTASIVLAVMILPIITSICREVFAQTPRLHEEAALALGATRWEMVRYAVFPYARSGMVSAVMLGLGRALGETMAIAMIVSPKVLISLFIIGTNNPETIAAHIAQGYKESTPDRLSVLIATGLVLFAFTFLVNALARWIVARGRAK